MKKIYHLPMLLFVILIFTFGCSPSTGIRMMRPADVNVPEQIQVIAVVDRSKPEKGFTDFLEGLLTGEDIGQDRTGRENAIRGVSDVLARTPRFEFVQTGLVFTGSKSGSRMVEPLPWSEISRICADFNADAVLAIEFLDSDNRIHTEERTRKVKDDNDNEIEEIYYASAQEIDIRLGWRLYDPNAKSIVDEFEGIENFQAHGSGNTESQARNDVPNAREIARSIGYEAGELYGRRIAPVWVTVNRTYYSTAKGSHKSAMEKAARLADANQWEEAVQVWKPIAERAADEKTAGKASYDMAVASEALDNLDLALHWARKAYTEYRNKKARGYIATLEERVNDRLRLKEQLGD